MHDRANNKETLKRFAQVVTGYLNRFEINGAKVKAAIEVDRPAQGTLKAGK